MSRVLILLVIAAISAAVRPPVASSRLCTSITDCEACLLVSSCYATYRPIARCLQYPIADIDDNNTIVIEKSACCPTSINFEPVECGFSAKIDDSGNGIIFPWAYIAAGATAVVVFLAGGAFWVIKICRRRGTLNLHNPRTEDCPLPPPAVLSPSTSRSSHPVVRQHKTMAELLQKDIQNTAETAWNNRRQTLEGHPFDQTTV